MTILELKNITNFWHLCVTSWKWLLYPISNLLFQTRDSFIYFYIFSLPWFCCLQELLISVYLFNFKTIVWNSSSPSSTGSHASGYWLEICCLQFLPVSCYWTLLSCTIKIFIGSFLNSRKVFNGDLKPFVITQLLQEGTLVELGLHRWHST